MYVKTKMTSNPVTVTSKTPISDAYELMKENKVRRLPVVDDGKLVGIVTERELQEFTPSKATTLSIHEINYLLSSTYVKNAMTTKVITTTSDTLLEEAALLMRDYRVSALPVVDNNNVVGIITETDIFDSFTELMGLRVHGTRITVLADNTPGVLGKIANIIGEVNINIIRLAVYQGESGKSQVVARVNSTNTKELEVALEKAGYPIIHILKNE